MSGGEPDEPGLSHVDEAGRVRMVQVGQKDVTLRSATARAAVQLSPATAARLVADDLPKGDVLPTVRVAAIQAAKHTPSLIPLCHQVAVTGVEVDIEVSTTTGAVVVTVTATARDRTGVEMEAMTAASVAALTLYDMVKAVQRDVVIGPIQLLAKAGGRTGSWQAPTA